MKIARIKNDNKLLLANELIEYPLELEGNRNLFTGLYTGHANHPNYNINNWTGAVVKIKPNTTYTVKRWSDSNRFQVMTGRLDNGIYAKMTGTPQVVGDYNENHVDVSLTITSREDDEYLVAYLSNQGHFEDILLKVEEGSTATPYIASPEELGYEYPDFIKKFNQKIYPHGVFLTPEIVEYPAELEGRRNLLPTDYESFVADDLYGWIKLADEGTPLAVKAYDTGANVDMTSIYFGLTKIGKNFTGGGSFWLVDNGRENRLDRRTEEAMYFSFYPNNRVTFDRIFEKYKIKVETGYKNTPWTPAPEDLGLNYSSDIQYFNMGIKDNKLMVSELIEGGIDISTGKGNGMSSSSMYNASYAPKNLVDGSIVFGGGTAFASANNAPLPQWFQIDLGDIYYVDTVRWINNRTNARLPGNYRIEASTTGAFNGEEILVASKDNNTTYTWVEHRFSDTKCRYVRMTVTKIYAGSYFELAEWQIFGYPAVIDSY